MRNRKQTAGCTGSRPVPKNWLRSANQAQTPRPSPGTPSFHNPGSQIGRFAKCAHPAVAARPGTRLAAAQSSQIGFVPGIPVRTHSTLEQELRVPKLVEHDLTDGLTVKARETSVLLPWRKPHIPLIVKSRKPCQTWPAPARCASFGLRWH